MDRKPYGKRQITNQAHPPSVGTLTALTVILSIITCCTPKVQKSKGHVEVQAVSAKWTFDDVGIGKLPEYWRAEGTNQRGPVATWVIKADVSAPSKPNVLALTDTKEGWGGTFNLLWTDRVKFENGVIEVKVKAETGREDQGGGPIWRVQDKDNYYIARWNPLEDNFRVYTVKNGSRKTLESASVKLDPSKWHTIRIEHRGEKISCYIDGEGLKTIRDNTFHEAGGVGLWTKADAASSFDDLVVVQESSNTNIPQLGKYITDLYFQLTRIRVGTAVTQQPETQRSAEYVGSQKCVECHEKEWRQWRSSYHSKMIQSVKQHPNAIIGDFAKLPADADFSREEVVYTIGGKFKQRYMLQSPKQNMVADDYVIGNYQWNHELQRWQTYAPYKDWYADGFVHDNEQVPTSRTCDGCHFVGFMSREQRVEPGTSCESCHGPGSAHVESEGKNDIYTATDYDPHRATEICLQCHMRNRDKRLETMKMKDIFGDVRDYPKGFEPGMPLINYKTQAPFDPGQESKEFYANGVGKKNRMQGNDFIRSMMYKHGITCVNCHNPHKLDATSTTPLDNSLCMKCHAFGSVIGPHQEDLKSHARCGVYARDNSCIECHMPKTGRHLRSSPVTVRTHVLGFITPDETRKYGVPNPCTSCHQDQSLEWAEARLKEWGVAQWK